MSQLTRSLHFNTYVMGVRPLYIIILILSLWGSTLEYNKDNNHNMLQPWNIFLFIYFNN